MKFKYSCFTENTPEMREWLEKLGITRISSDIGNLILVINGQYICFELEGDLGNNFSDAINCIGNPALFKAVTAVREDSDYMQWFTDGVAWVMFDENKSKRYYEVYFHKATLEELQEHFKTVYPWTNQK